MVSKGCYEPRLSGSGDAVESALGRFAACQVALLPLHTFGQAEHVHVVFLSCEDGVAAVAGDAHVPPPKSRRKLQPRDQAPTVDVPHAEVVSLLEAKQKQPSVADQPAGAPLDRRDLILFMASLGWAEACPKLV